MEILYCFDFWFRERVSVYSPASIELSDHLVKSSGVWTMMLNCLNMNFVLFLFQKEASMR